MEMWKTTALPMDNCIHGPMEKPLPFPQPANAVSHSVAIVGRLSTIPQRLRLLLPQKSRSLIEKNIISW